jgi:4,5-DOPA dioxygenase extradiol
VQLSVNALKPPEYHLELGAKIAALRARGVLVMGSGNVVHNLRAIDWSAPEAGAAWARRFDERAREVMTERPADVPRLSEHPDFRAAAPTLDHFLPLLYLAGLASAAGSRTDVLVDGYAYGSLSMTCFTLGASRPRALHERGGSAPLAGRAPPDDANV